MSEAGGCVRSTPRWVWTSVLLVVLAAESAAQTPASRADVLRQQRADKAQQLHPYTPGRLERGVLRLENEYLPRLVTPRTGFFPRFGSITSGGGFSLGPGYRWLDVFDGRGAFTTSAALSLKRYWVVESLLTMPRLANGRVFADVRVKHTSFPEEDYYGSGPDSSPADRVSFAIRQTTAGVDAGVRPTPWLRVGGTAEYFKPDIGLGADDRFPDVSERFDETTAPGLVRQPGFVRIGGFAVVDYARPFNPRRGGRYTASVHRYIDTDGGGYSFNRLDFDLQQYLPAFNERRVLALRTLGSFSNPVDEATVPFYLLRALGGNHTLRGVRNFRFRDRSLLLLQAEYRFEILTALDGALFYDTGQVAPSRRALALRDFERDYGIGLRVGSNAGVIVRFDVAFGSGEGTKMWLAFSHSF
jgi:hypothetical protein